MEMIGMSATKKYCLRRMKWLAEPSGTWIVVSPVNLAICNLLVKTTIFCGSSTNLHGKGHSRVGAGVLALAGCLCPDAP